MRNEVISLIKESLIGTDYEFYLQNESEINYYNKTYNCDLPCLDETLFVLKEVNHFPIDFAWKMSQKENPKVGLFLKGNDGIINFGKGLIHKQLVRLNDKIYFVKYEGRVFEV